MNSKDAFAENSFIYNRKFNILDSVRIPFQYAPACVCQIVILDVMLAFVPVCNTYAVSYTHLDVYKRQDRCSL